MTESQSGGITLYRTQDDSVVLDVRVESDTDWLNRQQLAVLFGRDIKAIGKHIANARREELSSLPTVVNFATVQKGGARSVERHVEYYNLEMVLSVGYRVKLPEGVK